MKSYPAATGGAVIPLKRLVSNIFRMHPFFFRNNKEVLLIIKINMNELFNIRTNNNMFLFFYIFLFDFILLKTKVFFVFMFD